MKIAYAQMKVAAGQPGVNTKKILQLIDEARTQGADIVIFPELAISGLMLGDTWHQKALLDECKACGKEIIAASQNIVVVFGNVMNGWMGIEFISGLYNSIFVARDGELIAEPAAKFILSPCEEKYFTAETDIDSDAEFEIEADGKIYKVACTLDEVFSEDDFDLCIKISSKPFDLDKDISFEKLQLEDEFADEDELFADIIDDEEDTEKPPLIYVGTIGIQNTGKTIYTFDGTSAVFNSRGEIVQIAEPFKDGLNFVEFEKIDKLPALELPEVGEAEKIYRAISYGVKTFLEQIGVNKVVIGVSGGIDSAVAAVLYVQVVGAENVYLINMPSKFNSATTKNLSELLAKNLGCKYYVVPIQESVDWTVKQLEERGFEVSNFVKENIQARDRSSRILATIAASVGGVFTCNANKAESTVGYATLYGDEAGFLSALADLWKFQVYDLARYMNEKVYNREVIPQGIIDIVPSAELSTAQNVDEGKGDPLRYPYHDYLFRAFVEKNLTPEDILELYIDGELEENIGCEAGLVEKYFPTAQDFITDLERWWKQFTGMGVAKRIQSPPILAVTEKPFGVRAESQNGVHFTRRYFELKQTL